MRRILSASLVGLVLGGLLRAQAGPMTNADVVLMVTSKLDEKIILAALDNATATAFDVSARGLTALRRPTPDGKVILHDKIVLEVQKVAAQKQPGIPVTNADVLAMVAGSLNQDEIIEAIDTASSTTFDVSPQGLVNLKAGGVNEAVMAHIQQIAFGKAAAGTVAPQPGPTPRVVPATSEPAKSPLPASSVAAPAPAAAPAVPASHVSAAEASKPREPGIYVVLHGTLVAVRVTVITQSGVGGGSKAMNSFFGTSVTMDATFAKGQSDTRVPSTPEFRFYGTAFDPNLFVLVKVYPKTDTRVIHVGKAGGFSGVKNGLDQKDLIAITSAKAEGGSYKVVVSGPLPAGEYAFVNAGDDTSKKIWDFGVN